MGKAGLILTSLGAAALLPACATEAEIAPESEVAPCGAEQFAYLVGQSEAEARAANLTTPHRVYGEHDVITMDYNPMRLNVVLGEDGVVKEVKCG